MDFLGSIGGTALLVAAALQARRIRNLRSWPTTAATVVHCDEVPPFGMTEEEIRRLRQPFHPVLDQEGNVVGVQERPFSPEIVYRAELVYFTDSRPREAELILDRPVKGTLALRFNPADPQVYLLEPPSYFRVWLLAAAALVFAWVCTWSPLR